jgi:hypothetical protein
VDPPGQKDVPGVTLTDGEGLTVSVADVLVLLAHPVAELYLIVQLALGGERTVPVNSPLIPTPEPIEKSALEAPLPPDV